MSAVIVIPARLASTRFPRKLLHRLAGRTLIEWTAERVRAEAPEFPLWFAVGEPELGDFLSARGYAVVPTDPDLPSGTDRIAAANRTIGAERIINVQADEPLVTGAQIRLLADLLDGAADLATLATPFRAEADFRDPNRVKVVRDAAGNALYFSRAPIPCDRAGGWPATQALLHLGLYAYTAGFLRRFTGWQPGALEQLERLEQLRALENGCRIAVGVTGHDGGFGIDTPADAERFAAMLARQD
jgi:3-deoxy-manno-octulosonate cytidylyltransferase (CMP-KDO synthetase)